jgi:hypothetical protein
VYILLGVLTDAFEHVGVEEGAKNSCWILCGSFNARDARYLEVVAHNLIHGGGIQWHGPLGAQ